MVKDLRVLIAACQDAPAGAYQVMRRERRGYGMVGIHLQGGKVRTVAAGGEERERATEAALLLAGRSGDDAALERLLALYKRPLYGLCHGILAHADDVEDAVQETFLRALRALPGFRGDAAFRTWLFRIAINVCLKWKGARRPTVPWSEIDHTGTQPSSSAEAIALRRLQMKEALNALTPRGRAVLLLRELEGWSVSEIAAAMGRSRKQIENELYRARCALTSWRQQDDDKGDGP